MIEQHEARDVLETTVYGSDGEKLGKVGQLFLDNSTGAPEFVTVNTGLFGSNESFVPDAEAELQGDRLSVPFDKATVKEAPNVDVESGHLDEADEQRLLTYYGRSGVGTPAGQADAPTGYGGPVTSDDDGAGPQPAATGTVGRDTSGPTTDEAMT